MHDIKIYGEIVPFQDSWIIENGYCNLSHVQEQLNAANGSDVRVRLNSCGGDVAEGFAIYSELRRYAKAHKAQITTLAEGRCASIATVIFLAGDTRILNEYVQPFVHNAWTYAMGDGKQIQRIADDLEQATQQIAQHYAAHTELTYDEARELMDAETSISPSEALEIRFATALEEILRPVALQKFSKPNALRSLQLRSTSNLQTHNTPSMKHKKTEKGFFNHLKKYFNNELKNAIEVYTSTQQILVFTDLEEGDMPKVGDKAEIEGKAAQGNYTLQDGTVYTFEAGSLTQIEPPQEQADDEIEALRQENQTLKKQLQDQHQRIIAIEAQQKQNQSYYNLLKKAVSTYQVDQKTNEPKTPNPTKQQSPLVAAIHNLRN